uniref:Multiple inositol polyphosphate phosphatase 1 n=5 Tax=Lilium TaxID=4688 RepID=Q0GYS2_LILLO|nr:alkaline phytase isoform 2 [Lilium longiflorum]
MAFSLHALIFALLLAAAAANDEPFDVRRHLSTVSSYDAAKNVILGSFVPSSVPDGCRAIHLNLVARHGTRAPTKKRIKEMDQLAIRLDALLTDAKEKTHDSSLPPNIPSWLSGWQSPWKGRQTGGELISKGEDELYHLGTRIRERFPDLFDEEYHPHIYSIRATQVPRASASAVAFGIGLFSGRGHLGPGKNRAFSVISESRASDTCLRFFDSCETYKEYRKHEEPAVSKLKEPVLDGIVVALVSRYQLNFTRQDVASLWFLCKQEASLLDITNQACGLFNPSEVSLLEWTDDLEAFIVKGYGNSVNYRMGVPLLEDAVQSMEQAIVANEENHKPGNFEKARLRFAHAETIVPFTCLLGLFLEGSEFEQIRAEQPLSLPPKPPQKRNWIGRTVAPFAGNNMLVLYHCPGNLSNDVPSGDHGSKYFVQVLHNEVPVAMPGCGNMELCPFEVFKEQIVKPHLKHDFNSVCKVKLELPESTKPPSTSCKYSSFFRRLFFGKDSNTDTGNQKTEL